VEGLLVRELLVEPMTVVETVVLGVTSMAVVAVVVVATLAMAGLAEIRASPEPRHQALGALALGEHIPFSHLVAAAALGFLDKGAMVLLLTAEALAGRQVQTSMVGRMALVEGAIFAAVAVMVQEEQSVSYGPETLVASPQPVLAVLN